MEKTLILKWKWNLHAFNNIIDEKHNGWSLSRRMFIHQSTCTVFTDNELRRIYKLYANSQPLPQSYFKCKVVSLKLACIVLSNQRLPLFHRAPPPCSIWAATRLGYRLSDTLGIGASKHTVKMLFWMARTDSLFVLSEYTKNAIWIIYQCFYDDFWYWYVILNVRINLFVTKGF